MFLKKLNIKDKNIYYILLVSLPIALIYTQMAPTLECDATTAINYARGLGLLLIDLTRNLMNIIINPSLISKFFEMPVINLSHFFYRPPGFPIFIILSGFFIFENIWSLFFFYFVISLLLPLIIYLLLKNALGIKLAFYSTIIIVLSTIPFGFITYFLADSLLILSVILSAFFFIMFWKNNKIRYIYLSSLFATLAFMTRTEGLVSLICISFFSILIFFIEKKSLKDFLNLFLSLFLIPVSYVFLWTSLVSYSIKDFKALGKITFGSGYFSMYSAYLGNNSGTIDKYLNSELFTKDYDHTIIDLYSNKAYKVYKFVDPMNGNATKELYDKIYNFLLNNPDSINRMIKSFENEMDLSDKYSPDEAYYKMFGRFKNDPKGLANNYFNSPDNYYLDFFNAELINIHGTATMYSLYKKVFFETLISNPVKFLVYFDNYAKIFSINFNCILEYFRMENLDCKNKLFPIKLSLNNSHYIDWWFDAGKCPSSVLTINSYESYSDEYFSKEKNLNSFLFLDNIKIIYRIVFGFLYLISILLIFFTKNKLINFFFLFLSQGNLIATVLGAGGSVGTRNEHLNLILMMMFVFLVFFNLKKKII